MSDDDRILWRVRRLEVAVQILILTVTVLAVVVGFIA